MKHTEIIELWAAIGEYEALNNCVAILEGYPALNNLTRSLKCEMDAIRDTISGMETE